MAAGPAGAAKLKTRSATVATTTDGQLVSATATCPKGRKAAGGGFTAEAAIDTGVSATDFIVVYESRRSGPRSWVVSGGRQDTGNPGPRLDMTALVNCRPKPFKIWEVSASTGIAGLNAATGSATAPCPAGKQAAAGGFSVTPPSLSGPLNFVLIYESFASAGAKWTSSGFNSGGATKKLTSYSYCKGPPTPHLRSATSAIPPGAVLPPSAAVTPTCQGKVKAAGGGFQAPPNSVTAPVITESQRVGHTWRAAAINLSPTLSGSITSFGYCR